jgi:hypothetical protein
MNQLIQSKNFTTFIVSAAAFACIGLLPEVQAVSPAPDGGYPGGNTAEGASALLSLTTGGFNTAVGFLSLRSNTTGQLNTAIGAGTLLANTADGNTATGAGALLSTTSGGFNTANGVFALFSNTTGGANTANGNLALFGNTTGNNNTATGLQALLSNTAGNANTANGALALGSNTTADNNTANGAFALSSNTTGDANTATGFSALGSNTTGNQNTATGLAALASNTIGFSNTAVGFQALLSNTGGAGDTAVGYQALVNATGSGETAVGFGAGSGVTTANNVIAIGSPGANVSGSCFIGNIRGVTTANADAIPVLIDSHNQLGTASSSRRFKKEIKPMDSTSEAILALKPVTFQYKSDNTNTPQFGLIAEEVAKLNADLVVRDEKGEIYTVRYDAVNAMLLNEFLKEHNRVEELRSALREQEAIIAQLRCDGANQEATIRDLKDAIETVIVRVKEQDSDIQRVRDQVQMHGAHARVVVSNQ